MDYTLERLAEMPAEELIEGLERRRFSVLKLANSRKLRAEMAGCGLVCRLALRIARCGPGQKDVPRRTERIRRRLARIAAFLAPCHFVGQPERQAECLIMGFNHPSLGEILRFVYVHLTSFAAQATNVASGTETTESARATLAGRVSLFPVNLPWYEMLAPMSETLRQLRIVIVPILTPSSCAKITKNVDANGRRQVEALRMKLSQYYAKRAGQMAAEERSAIWVAPSATRQTQIFRSMEEMNGRTEVEPPTMTLLAASVVRAKATSVQLVPVAVAPDQGCGRGLNLRKDYFLNFGPAISYAEMDQLRKQKCEHHRGRQLELEFRLRVAWLLLQMGRDDLVYVAPKTAP